ncbi:LPXTG cell wall anchor domain-containing protein [Xanthomonas sp. PPL568]|uniref:LPXTG cell wall anchor domain-containing protein n=1 Tax=Xanthomonas indica TaxID=2912242 RepID=UPI001F596664|nr:LPXTG cell wall anchor domain-containing protein [Xanthomonas indica]MCI2243826.1 LPXTG cell wall anchor domain-containing protein [Xanthomonas indica]
MSWPYWLGAAVIVLLLWLAFRRKRVADEIERFHFYQDAVRFADQMIRRGFDCFISRKPMEPKPWEVRCYRRKDRQQ